jgi:hypothetical protein
MNNTTTAATKIQTAYAFKADDFFYVAAETADGRRFVHQANFFAKDEEGRATNLVRRVLNDGEIDTQNWNEKF